MVHSDSRGRARQPGQHRGLRPLFPLLDDGWQSRALRVAMPASSWNMFDQLVAHFQSATLARSHGEAISYLLRRERQQAAQWLDWEQAKHARLLGRSGSSLG